MRIVNLKQFLAMPAGTVFAKYAPCFFEELRIKTENCGERDFFYAELSPGAFDAHDSGEWGDRLYESQETGAEVSLTFDIVSRDGCFKEDQLFAVFSLADVESLIGALSACKAAAYIEGDKQ